MSSHWARCEAAAKQPNIPHSASTHYYLASVLAELHLLVKHEGRKVKNTVRLSCPCELLRREYQPAGKHSSSRHQNLSAAA